MTDELTDDERAELMWLAENAADHFELDAIDARLKRLEGPLAKYCPHVPWPKQQQVLDEECDEIFFGGAAGPGKSDLLGMIALEHVDIPGYSVLIIRRTLKRLERPGGLLDRLRGWLANHKDVKYNSQKHTFTFDSGAQIVCSYLETPADRFEYQGQEYQRILVDELPEIKIPDDETNPFMFLRSRLRRPKCTVHEDKPDPDCYQCHIAGRLGKIKLKVVSTGNPGGISQAYCDKRYLSDEAKEALMHGDCDRAFYKTHRTKDGEQRVCFIPGRIEDNPALDREEYEATLNHLDPVTRARLMNGDWTVRPDGLINTNDLREAIVQDGEVHLLDTSGRVFLKWNLGDGYRFTTIDPAGTSRDRSEQAKGTKRSHSAISTFEMCPQTLGRYLVCLDVRKKQQSIPKLVNEIRLTNERWSPMRLRIEDEKLGHAVVVTLRDEMPIDLVPTGGKDKITRSKDLQLMAERHEIFLASNNEWYVDVVNEITSWTGHPDEEGDVVDTFSYGAIEAMGHGRGILDGHLFRANAWFDTVPQGFQRVACGIKTLDGAKIGDQTIGAIVYMGVRNDGYIYVDAVCDRFNMVEGGQQLIDSQELLDRACDFVCVAAEDKTSFESHALQNIASTHFNPSLIYAEPKEIQSATVEFLLQSIANGKFRWKHSHGMLAVVSRLKAYPHNDSKDQLPIEAAALALNALMVKV